MLFLCSQVLSCGEVAGAGKLLVNIADPVKTASLAP